MAESQKKETPSTKSKEKSSLLDIDIGDDFLGSWKSMSMAGDGMDFDFGTTSKSKKKDFKFDKMDMDFSLDADFGKLPSFKTDMSDFDISSPIKKSGNSKEKSKEASSGGKQQAKRDDFAFSFDFDEFADLDFGSTKKKTEEKCDKSKDNNKEGYSNTSGSVEGSQDLLAKDVDALKDDDISSKDNDTQVENTCRNENDQVKSLTYGSSNAEEQDIQTTISSDKIISSSNLEEPTQESHSSEERSSLEPQNQKVVQDSSGQSLDNVLDLPEEDSGSSGKMVTKRTISDNVRPMDEVVTTKSQPFESTSAQMNSESQKKEMCKAKDDDVGIGHVDGDDRSKLESFMTNVKENLSNEEMFEKRNADSAAKLVMGSLDSGITKEKERGNLSTRSKYFNKQDKSESEKQQVLVSSTKLISIGSKRMSSLLPNNPPPGKREFGSKSVETGSKFAGISRPLPSVISRKLPVQAKNTETSHASEITRECLNAENIKPRTEPMSTTVGQDTKEEKRREQHTLHVNPLRSDVIPFTSVKQSIQDPSQKSLNPGMKSMGKIVVEKNQISSPKVSTIKVSRITEPKLKPLNSMLPPSMRNKEPEKTVFKRNPSSLDTNKQTPSTPTLKRKTFEASAVTPTFTPSKRLSTSPFSNSFTPSSQKAVEQQMRNHASMANEKSPRLDASALEIDIYSASQNDALYQQAEACSKELDIICGMLKKKHEEAKDILVRALVNNNNLLMLNHPIHQHKFLMVQKFAASLSLH